MRGGARSFQGASGQIADVAGVAGVAVGAVARRPEDKDGPSLGGDGGGVVRAGRRFFAQETRWRKYTVCPAPVTTFWEMLRSATFGRCWMKISKAPLVVELSAKVLPQMWLAHPAWPARLASGRFPGLVDLSEPLAIDRFARNPRIARVCADLQFGQELGEGIRRIFNEMRLAGLVEPAFVQTAGTVRLRLLSAAVDSAVADRLSPSARAVLAALRETGASSTGEVMPAPASPDRRSSMPSMRCRRPGWSSGAGSHPPILARVGASTALDALHSTVRCLE